MDVEVNPLAVRVRPSDPPLFKIPRLIVGVSGISWRELRSPLSAPLQVHPGSIQNDSLGPFDTYSSVTL